MSSQNPKETNAERVKRLARETKRQEDLAQAESAFSNKEYQKALNLYREYKNDSEEARRALSLVLTEAAEGEERKWWNPFSLYKAYDYYQELKSNGDESAKRRITALRARSILATIVLIALLGFVVAQVNRVVPWPPAVCNAPLVGGMACTPSPTFTLTPTFTPTPTFTLTPTFTPTLTFTPTSTFTLTATPIPQLAEVMVETYFYASATGVEHTQFLTALNTRYYVCEQEGDRVLLAEDFCHLVKPKGWVKTEYIHFISTLLPTSTATP